MIYLWREKKQFVEGDGSFISELSSTSEMLVIVTSHTTKEWHSLHSYPMHLMLSVIEERVFIYFSKITECIEIHELDHSWIVLLFDKSAAWHNKISFPFSK